MKTGFGSRGFHHLVFVVAMATLALLPTRAFAVRWIIVNHTSGGIGTGYSKSYTFHVSNGTQDYDWSGLNCGPNTTNQTECGEVPTYDLSYYAVTNVTGLQRRGGIGVRCRSRGRTVMTWLGTTMVLGDCSSIVVSRWRIRGRGRLPT